MRRDTALMLLAALMLPAAAAYAKPMTFTVNLTQALGVPATGSPATGSGTVVLDPTANTLGVHLTFGGLTSNTIMAHIHCCLTFPFATGVAAVANVGVATTVPAFPGFPIGVTSGTYDHVLDLTSLASYNSAFVTLQGGTVAGAEAALIRGIVNGETYLNIHTTNFPSGEIRGFLVAAPTPAQLSLLKTIPINGTAASPNTKLFSFDISFVDPATGLYYLADRSNAALDVVDTTGAFTGTPDSLFGQIGGAAFNFGGDTGLNMPSNVAQGPNGVAARSPCIFATDGLSRVVSINSNVSFVTPMSSVSTGGTHRADELAIDPNDSLLLVINNADTPPFGTLISFSATCALTVKTKIPFTAANGINATNLSEQPAWDPLTQRFYVSIPEINGLGGGGPNGAVAKINPLTGAIETFYPVNFMQPAGLTLGPNGDLLVGSNTVFDTSGTACKAVVPAPMGVNTTAPPAPATCTGIAFPQAAICNPNRGCTPANGSLVSVPGVGGGDEVWYNSGDGNYYVTASNDPVGPVFGVVGSVVNTLSQLVPTLPPVPANGTANTATFVHSSGTAHSITASAANNHVYLALPANTDYPNCAQGCIAVFSTQ